MNVDACTDRDGDGDKPINGGGGGWVVSVGGTPVKIAAAVFPVAFIVAVVRALEMPTPTAAAGGAIVGRPASRAAAAVAAPPRSCPPP